MWAPGVHEDDIPGVGHSDELFLQWDPWRGEQHTLNSEDSRLSLEVSTLYSALYILYCILYCTGHHDVDQLRQVRPPHPGPGGHGLHLGARHGGGHQVLDSYYLVMLYCTVYDDIYISFILDIWQLIER